MDNRPVLKDEWFQLENGWHLRILYRYECDEGWLLGCDNVDMCCTDQR